MPIARASRSTPRPTRSAPTASSSPASPRACCRWPSAISSSEQDAEKASCCFAPVLMITESSVSCGAVALAGKERDTLRLTWQERRWTRKRVETTAGRMVALALPTGSVLRDGDVLAVEEEGYLVVEARPAPVLA